MSRERTTAAADDGTWTLPATPHLRFFVDKLRSLGVHIEEDLVGFRMPGCWKLVYRQFPSFLWDILLEELVPNDTLQKALEVHILMADDREISRNFLIEQLGDTAKKACAYCAEKGGRAQGPWP